MSEQHPNVVDVSDAEGITAPHADTSQATYTVPTGKMARIRSLQLTIIRFTAATGNGTVQLDAKINSDVIAAATALTNTTSGSFNTVGNKVEAVVMGPGPLLKAGDVLDLRSSDTCTGGTVYYVATVVLDEFDDTDDL